MGQNQKMPGIKNSNPLTGIATALFFLLWVFTLYSYFNSPDTVPSHFNAAGKPDGYSGKSAGLWFAGIASFIFVILTVVRTKTRSFNYPVTITESNRERQYELASRFISGLNIVCMALFLYIAVAGHLVASNKINGLGNWFLPVVITLFAGSTFLFLFRSFKKA